MAAKRFLFKNLKVFYKHTNFYGVAHPYNFYEWTSYVREAFFSELSPDFRELTMSSIKMMTSKIALEMQGDSIFGDEIEAEFTATRIRHTSFDVIVRFINKRTHEQVCRTQHTLVFLDSKTNTFTDIPESIKNAISYYQE